MVAAGKLRHLVTIESPVSARDAYGQNIPTWTTAGPFWAEILTLSGKQLALSQADTLTSTATHQITMRFREVRPGTDRIRFAIGSGTSYAGMSEADYLALSESQYAGLGEQANAVSRVFAINSASDPDQRRFELKMMATEVVG